MNGFEFSEEDFETLSDWLMRRRTGIFDIVELDGFLTAIVDEWCIGFVRGMRMDTEAWKPLRQERPELIKPLELFGTRAGWRELKAGGEAAMHGTWSQRIAPAVREIYAFWLPHRQRVVAAAGVR